MLVVVICLGLLYALPNIYGEDPAIQISGSDTAEINVATQDKIKKLLTDNHIEPKSIVYENKSILIRLGDNDTQLKAKEIISEALGEQYIVALNLAPATPTWLTVLGAEPMKLGLDLRGGVHFLMEVDMTTALNKLTEQSIENIKTEFTNSKLNYKTISKDGNQQIAMQFDNTEDRNKAITKISGIQDFKVVSQSENSIVINVSEQRLQQAKSDAVQQNTTILRNRVNQLGVAEPIVQRQGADRIVVELPGIQDTALAKRILGATATLEFRQVNEESSPNMPAILKGDMRIP